MSYPARHGSYHSGWWDPSAELDAMRRRLEQLLAWESSRNGPTERASGVALGETGDGWVLEAPLPGVPPTAVDVELTERDLIIRGEAISRQAEVNTAPRRFSYRIPLPGEVLADQVQATLEYGVLTVRLPRSPRAASRRIPVNIDPGTRVRTSADEQPTEPLPRRSPDRTAAPGQVPQSSDAPEPTTAPPYQEPASIQPDAGYQEPGYSDRPDEPATGRSLVPGQDSPPPEYPIIGQESAAPGSEYPGQPSFFPWPNHSRSDQDHPT